MRQLDTTTRLAGLVSALVLWGGCAALVATTTEDFAAHFTGRTIRFDYSHSGTATDEEIAFHRFRLEGEWPGRRDHLLDDLGLGKYFFHVVDARSGELLYSQGFASIYGEWETTGEARGGFRRTFHESQRFPETKEPADLMLLKRDSTDNFLEIYRVRFDPASRLIDRSPVPSAGEVWAVFEHGPATEKVDLLVLGDGYALDELDTYRQDVNRVVTALFSFPPFREHRASFNVWAIDVVSEQSGVTKPRSGFWNRTPLGLTYNAFDSERYMLSFDNERLREIAAQAPYDALILIANSEKYGGGGIYNLYSTAAARSAQLPYLIVHEFGHAFAGLGDEYYTSSVSYEEFNPPGVEPSEPNVTALLDAKNLKWRRLLSPGVPIPTPWDQATYDRVSLAFQEERRKLREAGVSEARMDVYFAEVKRATSKILEAELHHGKVGAFEGSSYQAKGLYRPSVDCIMFSRNPDHYCPVCSAAIERVIESYTRNEIPSAATGAP